MTSSLVGSEMCIRDRRMASKSRKATKSRSREATRSRSKEATKSRSREAVSYTHLTLPTICSV
eukprot:1764877-Prorocentrum_lima.AAC.1